MTRVVGLKVTPNLEPFVRNGLAGAGFLVVETIQPKDGLDCMVISVEQIDFDPVGLLERTVSSLPVIVVLLRRDDEFKRRLLRAGAAEVVVFDGDAQGVVEAVDDALSRAAYLSAHPEQLPAERVLQSVLEAAPVGIMVVDAAGRLIRSSRVVESIWGSVPDLGATDIRAMRVGFWADESAHRGERLERDEWPMARALRGETVQNEVLDIEPVGQPGVRRRIVSAAAPVLGASGQVIGAVVAEVDLSPVVLAEAGLRESETRFRELADNIAQMAWMTDATGFIHWYNRRWYDYTGTSLTEMQGWGWQAVHHPEHVDRVTEKFKYHLVFGEPWEDIFPLRRHDGEYRWFLSRAFPLRDSSGDIVSWFGTNTDITDQRRAEESLREADRRKDEFIAILAHELRNPLAPVRNAVRLMQSETIDADLQRRARDIIERQVSQMARLIDDLLDVSRLARGKLALNVRLCDLSAIAAQTAEDYRSYFDEKGVVLEVEKTRRQLLVMGDPVRLGQMVGNLLHNAARFTDPGGTVLLRCSLDDRGFALVSVVDSGAGIEKELLGRLFDPFCQEEQDLARSKGGLGLGLSLTRGFAELHGGRVSAHSQGPGSGSTFQIAIPLCESSSEVKSSPPSFEGARALKVLIVEDNVDAAEMLAQLFVQAGHEPRLAHDGSAALQVLSDFLPDAIISDLGLPGAYDGYALGQALRADPSLSNVYLIALSGYANEDARRRSRQAGYDVHVAKPPDFRELLALISTKRE